MKKIDEEIRQTTFSLQWWYNNYFCMEKESNEKEIIIYHNHRTFEYKHKITAINIEEKHII